MNATMTARNVEAPGPYLDGRQHSCCCRLSRYQVSPLLGAHVSVASGLPLAVDRAVAHRCEAFQIFAKNANQWRGRIVPREEVAEFRAKVKKAGLAPVVSH